MAQKKATIIKVSDDKVSIGMEDGSFFDVSRKELNFLPSIGDEVSVFSNGDMKIVSKLETSTKKILPKEQNFQNYGNENVFAEYAPDQNIFSQLDGKSKTGLVLGICGALAILVAIIIAFANNTSNLVSSDLMQNAYSTGYENGFMLKDRMLCFDLAEVDYTALYGAPLTAGEKSNFREYKASYQKGCLDGENAAGE
jgi:hypothetical protein